MLAKLHRLYPQCGIISELVNIDRGLYIVKVSIEVGGKIIATGLAGTDRVETSEDLARERAISTLNFNSVTPETKEVTSMGTTAVMLENTTQIPVTSIAKSNQSTRQSNGDISTTSPKTKVIDLDASRGQEKPPLETIVAPEENFATTDVATEKAISSIHLTSQQNQDREIISSSIPQSQPIAEVVPEDTVSVDQTMTSVAPNSEVVEVDFNEIKHKTDIEIKRLGWTKEDGRNFLRTHYGKRTRLHLTDEQLLEFLQYLESQPTPSES